MCCWFRIVILVTVLFAGLLIYGGWLVLQKAKLRLWQATEADHLSSRYCQPHSAPPSRCHCRPPRSAGLLWWTAQWPTGGTAPGRRLNCDVTARTPGGSRRTGGCQSGHLASPSLPVNGVVPCCRLYTPPLNPWLWIPAFEYVVGALSRFDSILPPSTQLVNVQCLNY